MIKYFMMLKLRPFFYGLAELSPSAIDIFLKVYLLVYFNQVLGLSATLTSFVIGASVLWDALIDPWIGGISDRYKEKYGNRKLILFIAGAAMAVIFFTLWRIPAGNHNSSYVLLFIISAVLNSCISFFSVPYYAIANDLEKDNDKRRTWIGWRLVFFNVGSLIGLSVPAYFLTQGKVLLPQEPYLHAVTFLVTMTIILTLIATHFMYYKTEKDALVKHNRNLKLKTILKDKIFLQVLLAFFVVNCGLGLNSTLALYYYKEFLNFTQEQTQLILVSFLLFFTVSIPLWVILTRFFTKKNLIVYGAIALGLMTMISFPLFSKANFWVVFTVASALGGLLVGVAVVMEIYLADYLNEKELELKQSLSGQFLGLWKMAAKVSRAIAIGLAGPIIEISTGNPQLLANFFGGVVGLFFILSGIIFLIPVSALGQKS